MSQSAGSTRDVNIAACLTSQEHGVLSCHYFPDDASHISHNLSVFVLRSFPIHILISECAAKRLMMFVLGVQCRDSDGRLCGEK